MKWLLALETEKDLIVTCRVMNIFRRKDAKITSLALATGTDHLCAMAVLDAAEADVDHMFHFLRRMDGIQHVSYYRHERSANASFVFVDADPESDALSASRFAEIFPGARLIFASNGKFLFEVPGANLAGPALWEPGGPEVLPFACVRTTRPLPQPQLGAA
ncbi:MAG: hypothetical protein ACRD3T_07640 [Terriglobia bacterium]